MLFLVFMEQLIWRRTGHTRISWAPGGVMWGPLAVIWVRGVQSPRPPPPPLPHTPCPWTVYKVHNFLDTIVITKHDFPPSSWFTCLWRFIGLQNTLLKKNILFVYQREIWSDWTFARAVRGQFWSKVANTNQAQRWEYPQVRGFFSTNCFLSPLKDSFLGVPNFL